MGHLVRIVLPNQDEGMQGEILDRIMDQWGGCTMWKATGLWRDPTDHTGGTLRESVLVVECSVPHWREQTRSWWHRLAADVAKAWDQDCVYLSVREETATLVEKNGAHFPIGGGE